MRTSDQRYPQCRCVRFGQSRFEPVKRIALDGKIWWCILDRHRKEYVQGFKFGTRRKALVRLSIEFRNNRLPYEPDPGFSKHWLLGRTMHEMAYLVDHRRLKQETCDEDM